MEDEPIIADDIAISLEEFGFEIEEIVASSEEALAHLENHQPNIVLLDIKIEGGLDGIRLAHLINEKYQIPFVFISSMYDHNTLTRAKSTNPAGYIVKPFKESDLKVNIELALTKNNPIMPPLDEQKELKFFVKQAGAMIPLDFNEVTHIEGDDNYAIFHTNSGKHTVAHTLKEIDNKLSNRGFCRVHKKYIINLSKVDRIEQSVLFIEETMIPIGKAYRKGFFDHLAIF